MSPSARKFAGVFAWITFVALLESACGASEPASPKQQAPTTPSVTATADPAAEAECARKVAALKAALASDRLSETETFNRHRVKQTLRGTPADVDLESNRFAQLFRTRLRQELAQHGVNFAGVYSLVSVGMTGWGDNWYIVDRRDGKVTLFPYHASFLDFRKDSNLIVMNSKEEIEKAMRAQDVDCYFLNQEEFTSLRSFYFLWEEGQLRLIGPPQPQPPANRFWSEYLGKD